MPIAVHRDIFPYMAFCLPPGEQMPGGPLVLGAYGFIWAVVLVYVYMLSRRLQAVQKDIDALKRQTRN